MKRHAETIGVVRASCGLQAKGHAFGVTVLAAGADLRAARDRVPGALRPFDLRSLCHDVRPLFVRGPFLLTPRLRPNRP